VDDADFEWLSQWKWCVNRTPNHWYACRHEGPRVAQRIIFMHREILGAPRGLEVDHIDGDSLNNQRSNLRLATRRENKRNQRYKKAGASSQYKGVFWNTKCQTWCATICVTPTDPTKREQHLYLGRFDSEVAAARAYDAAAREHHGAFAAPNFTNEGANHGN
jgi:hypothetical protein